ncbi:hypothetical protein RHGRI_003813 [Rhododendron griersonianum]|uniref:Uncharacterized protein n=1 Tax=Rhododendron griersonianum TaxID=479676 RepID=A0AAV6L7J5_9ERIC|nr:hypothetical protein RHGRI_003813 [Rhododendron griersonianum]
MFVAPGSTIYVLGGEDEGFLCRDVYYFETANDKKNGGAEVDGEEEEDGAGSKDGMPVRIKDDEVEEEVAGEVSRMPKLRNNMSTNIKFEEVDDEVETAI